MTLTKEENPRQKLLETIAAKGPITIKDLRQVTGMSVGSLYHHLSKLEEYVIRDEQKRYLLSQRGREFFASENVIQLQRPPWNVFFITPVLRNMYSSIITIIVVLQLYLLAYSNSSQLFLLPVRHGSVIESIVLGWMLSVLAAEGLSIAAGARAGHGMLSLAAGISLATIPVVALSMIDNIYASIPLYIISLFIATAAISSAKSLSYASSIPVALSVLLISIAVFTAALGPVVIIPISITVTIIILARLGYFDMIASASRTK
ncbi:MAG: winged helix-turn-helix transcriptional regulator [Nitrososphaerales archaeon]